MIDCMAYPKRLLTGGEEVVREFRAHWRLLVIPAGWTVLLGAAVVATWMFPPDNATFDWAITAVAFVAFLILGFYPFISWWFAVFVLTNERLITRSGVLARKGKEIPLENINDVTFSQSILERLLRSGDLVVESAGEIGQSTLGPIPNPEEFQSLVYRVREDRSRALSSPMAPQAAGSDDTVSRLERLAQLQRDGMISREEYEAQKSRLLGQQ
jgi:uncharacterized membrane protein YdbT with pleckstrin-like domain